MKNLLQKCDWEITTNCNLNCKHCLINYKPKKELSTKECLMVIDLLGKLRCKQINFTGGEALTKKDFFKILDYSHKKGMINNLFSNGAGINPKNIRLIKRCINFIGISLEGIKKENDLIRGRGAYNKTVNSIKLLKENDIPFGFYLTMNKNNIRRLGAILEKIKKFNPSNIILSELVFRGLAKKNKDELYTKINREQILGTVKRIFPHEKFKIEMGCNINPRNIFLTSEGKFYFCTEIRQCKKSENLGSFLPPDFHKFTEFSKSFFKKNLPKKCPYVSYVSKNITLNFLTDEKCPYLK